MGEWIQKEKMNLVDKNVGTLNELNRLKCTYIISILDMKEI